VNADVARLEAERLRPGPKQPGPTTEALIRELVHVLAHAMGVGKTL